MIVELFGGLFMSWRSSSVIMGKFLIVFGCVGVSYLWRILGEMFWRVWDVGWCLEMWVLMSEGGVSFVFSCCLGFGDLWVSVGVCFDVL